VTHATNGGGRGYAYWTPITTRWMDNDPYGHVNNVQYYSFFDTVVTQWLVQEAGFDPHHDDVIGLCAESRCVFHAPLVFPGTVSAGLRVGHIGRASVRYEIALFGEDGDGAAAEGHFVHVFVDRRSRRSHDIPAPIRRRLQTLVVVEQRAV
jgi:acyl-CoA thioester hydrolase